MTTLSKAAKMMKIGLKPQLENQADFGVANDYLHDSLDFRKIAAAN